MMCPDPMDHAEPAFYNKHTCMRINCYFFEQPPKKGKFKFSVEAEGAECKNERLSILL